MKTVKEKIEVMTAYEEGRKIEARYMQDGDWFNCPEPRWNWDVYDYRVKEEPKYRPYKDTEEMINDFCERFGVKRTNFGEPFIWVKAKTGQQKSLITDYDNARNLADLSYTSLTLTELFEQFTYLNDSLIGKLEN